MRWNDLKQSGFFRWFGITEIEREVTGDGFVSRCKPGGYQEVIDLSFTVGGGSRVCLAELEMDRAWMDDAGTAPFAADLSKSFVLALGSGDAVIAALGRQLEQMVPLLPGVISRADGAGAADAPLDPAMVAAGDAYSGRRPRAELTGEAFLLVVDNTGAEGAPQPGRGQRCRIVLSPR